MLFKNLSLLAYEMKLQDFGVSQKKFVIPQIHYFSWFFSYKAKDTCYMSEKRLAKVSVVYLSLI